MDKDDYIRYIKKMITKLNEKQLKRLYVIVHSMFVGVTMSEGRRDDEKNQ